MNIHIPQANPKAENDELSEEINDVIRNVLASGRYILGPEVEAFEREFAYYTGAEYAISVGSGTDALSIALKALGVGMGDEVITVSHTAVATVAAIELCGAVPIFCDIDPQTYTINPEWLENLLSPRTRAIIPVHLYGHPANLGPIIAFAKKYGLLVLEDCAQAHGAIYNGKKAGSWGDIAAFSFYPTKNLGAIGDGGMIVTSDARLAENAFLLRQYGWKNRYISEIQGSNSRLDELQAAILRVKLRHLDENNAKRRGLAELYSQLLKQYVVTPSEMVRSRHVYHLYVIRYKQRDRLQEYLRQRGIGTAIHYPLPVHQQPAYKLRIQATNLPVTDQVVTEILSLPIYPQLSEDMVREIALVIRSAVEVIEYAG